MWDVTWGHGGPDYTVRCASEEDARRVAQDVLPWGPVVKPRGECPWQIRSRAQGESSHPNYATHEGRIVSV